jgi:UDP-GlcNAc:undecaprenyl-phosphate/decaprenyl-phosphate GlcNAc-1-phosphate transferase
MAAVSQNPLSFDYAAIVGPYMAVFYVAFLVTIVLTPIMRALAHQHGVVDDPDNKRKVHTQPIAYLGGVSIFLGWLAGITVSVFLRPHNDVAGAGATVQIPPGIFMGASAVVLFGLMDDIYSLSPKMKLLGQFLAAGLLILPGVIPGLTSTDFLLGARDNLTGEATRGPAWMIFDVLSYLHVLPASKDMPAFVFFLAPILSGAVAVFIIIAACNSANLLDGLDGLCSGVTSITFLGYLFLAVYLAHSMATPRPEVDPVRICLSLALLGALLGFLPFNFHPASIFMGDTGSMFLGFMCGTMMLLFGQNGPLKFFLGAIVMFGLPMMDTFLAIVRRKLAGRKIFSPDSNHFHHFLIRHGLSVRSAVLLSYGIAAIFVSFALVVVIIPTRLGLGVYLVLFGWIIVTAFKMGMVVYNVPTVTANTTLNLSVIAPITRPPGKKPEPKPSAGDSGNETANKAQSQETITK